MRLTKRGKVYKSIQVEDVTIDLYYCHVPESGHAESAEPNVQYPNFKRHPVYLSDGTPLVLASQGCCRYYKAKPDGVNWCYDCFSYKCVDGIIGLCQCEKRRKPKRGFFKK